MSIRESFIITEIVNKTTSSNSIIVKGIFNDKEVYGKFYINSSVEETDFSGIIYEQQIYKYIKDKTVEMPEISNHMVASIHDFENISLYDYIQTEPLIDALTNFIRINFNKIILKYQYRIDRIDRSKYNMLFNGFLVLDTKMDSLSKYLPKINQHNYIDIFFELLYSNLLMRNYLNIMHNDIHFGNIFIQELDEPYEYEYILLGIKKLKKFKVLLYDHDHNYSKEIVHIISENKYLNRFLCKDYGSCNLYNNKDGYVLINNIFFYKNRLIETIGIDIYIDLFNIISNKDITDRNTNTQFSLIKKYSLTHAFCDWRLNSKKNSIKKTHCGSQIDNPELNINEIMSRYIMNYKTQLFDSQPIDSIIFSNIIHISIYLCISEELRSTFRQNYGYSFIKIEDQIVSSSFKNKYLKYKKKFLLLKEL